MAEQAIWVKGKFMKTGRSVSTSVCFAQVCDDAQVMFRLKCFTNSTSNYGHLSNEQDCEMLEMPQEGADGSRSPPEQRCID